MALSQADALVAVRDVLLGQRPAEARRLDRLHEAVRPTEYGEYRASVQVPPDAPLLMRELARKSETPYLSLLLDTFAQVMKVEGYITANDAEATDPWLWWQRARMDSRQTGLVRAALHYGTSYASALPGTYGRGEVGPAISLYSPREMTALYQDPEADEWPMLAVGVDGNQVSLFDEEMRYRFGIEPGPLPYSQRAGSLAYGGGALTFIDAEAHDMGVCPIVRYRDRNLLSGEESLGIIEPLLIVQERITEATFQALTTDFFQTFKQRYLIGWVPKSEEDELKSGRGTMWYLDEDPKDVTIGELAEGSVNLDMRNAAIRDFAAIGQIPAQAMGIDGISNISDATLAGLEAAKNRKAAEITTSLGESHEQLLRLCAYIDGNATAADDYNAEVRWANFEARSFAATVDGITKLVQIGLDPGIALEDVPGMTEQRLVRAQKSLAQQRARDLLASRTTQANGDASATA